MDSSFDSDDLSTAFGTETLAEREMVPEGFDNAPNSRNSMPIELVSGRRFLKVDQTANLRAGSKVSKIWEHGFEYRSLDNGLRDKYWRCKYCKAKKLLKITEAGNTTTSHAIRHLKKKHPVSWSRGLDEEEDQEEDQEMDNTPSTTLSTPSNSSGNTIPQMFATIGAAAGQVARDGYRALVSAIDADKFRWMLIKWIVSMHIALSVVENKHFRELIITIAPALEKFVVHSGTTIRRWIRSEFEKQRLIIKKRLAKARSKIHISFDLWTAPNHRTFVGVVAHWLDEDLKKQEVLISLRRVIGVHTGENIASVMIPLLHEYGLNASKLGFFQADNLGTNDVAIRFICKEFGIPKPDSRRVRCLGHIINLAAKAFLFGTDVDSFEAITRSKMEKQDFEAVRKLWRTKGPFGKFHNTVLFIRKTPQRRDE
jgi:BED zinc finger